MDFSQFFDEKLEVSERILAWTWILRCENQGIVRETETVDGAFFNWEIVEDLRNFIMFEEFRGFTISEWQFFNLFWTS